ncbi:MAG: hypothetical protein KDC38_08045 [Planctomycetes bacterium]|nr:hypothetical protein [Planctomycetota bacterium]
MSQRRWLWGGALALAVVWGLVAWSDAQEGPRSSRPARRQGEVAEGTVDDARATRGAIPVLDVLRYLQLSTGQSVVYPSVTEDPYFRPDAKVQLLGDMDLTPSVAKSLLVANGYLFFEEVSGDTVLLHARHSSSRTSPEIPHSGLIVGSDEDIPDGSPGVLITAFTELRRGDASTVVLTLRELLGLRSGADSLRIVPVQNLNTIVVSGRRDLVRHVRQLIPHLDRPSIREAEKRATEGGNPAGDARQ